MVDDATLLRDYARNRSEPAFAEIVQRHLPLVYSSALRRLDGDAHRANDVAQIVFTALARDAAALSRHAALTGWLYAATRNAAIDLLRTDRRRRNREAKVQLMEDVAHSPGNPVDWEQLRPVLDGAMDELDARDREAVLLRFFEGRPFASVAAALRVSEEAARKRVDRALDKLGALLARRGIASTNGALAVLLANHTAVAAPASIAETIAASATAAAAANLVGSGGLAASGFFAMSTTKVVTGIFAGLGLLVGGAVVYRASVSRTALILPTASASSHQAARSSVWVSQPPFPHPVTGSGRSSKSPKQPNPSGSEAMHGVTDGEAVTRDSEYEGYVTRAVATNMAMREAEYTELFATLGLTAEAAAELREKIAGVYAAKMWANRGVGDFKQALSDYDAQAKVLLGKNYDFYREHEAAFPARREYDYMEVFIRSDGLTLVAEERARVEKLIREFDAYGKTADEWNGPYQPGPPKSIEGKDAVVARVDREIARIESAATALMQQARASGFSTATLTALDAYYASEIARRLADIDRMNDPMGTRIKRMEEDLAAERNRPVPDPKLIRSLETRLQMFRRSQGVPPVTGSSRN